MEIVDVKSKTSQELEELKVKYFEHRVFAKSNLNTLEIENSLLKKDTDKFNKFLKNGQYKRIQDELTFYKSKFQECELIPSSITRELKVRHEEEIQSKKITKSDIFMSVAKEILPKELYDDIMTEVRVKMICI